MKFGVFSVSMPEYDVEQSVALLKELGYDGVEWRVAEMPASEPTNVPFAFRYWAYNKSTLEVRDIANEAARAIPVFVAGDARTGSTLVSSAMADALRCAAEVHAHLQYQQ